MLAKITSKNQLTLPKSVTESIGPVQYFEVQAQGGQIILTPVRIQRGDALRAKLAELALDPEVLEKAFSWGAEKPSMAKKGRPKTVRPAETPAQARKNHRAKPLSTGKTVIKALAATGRAASRTSRRDGRSTSARA